MRATLKDDMIVMLGRGNSEIPDNYPRHIGLERLRFDGKKIVDLGKLNQIWVRCVNGAFTLHCKAVDGATLLDMTYADRKKLIVENGLPRLKTATEETAAARAEKIVAAKATLARLTEKSAGNLHELLMFNMGLLFALCIFVRTNNAAIAENLDEMLPYMQNFPLKRMATLAPEAYQALKTIVDNYFGTVDTAIAPSIRKKVNGKKINFKKIIHSSKEI